MTQAFEGMDAAAVSIRNIFEFGADGNYQLKDGELWKGTELNVSDSSKIVDEVKDQTGLDVTIFYGDTRYLTTITNSEGERQIGTKASDIVIEQVLKNGKNYSSDNVNILGTRYICYYVPIWDESGSNPVGMVFLGEHYDQVYVEIADSVKRIVFPMLFVLFIGLIFARVVGKRIIDSIQAAIAYLNQLAEGKLGFCIDSQLLHRRDVVGDMCRSIENLNRQLTEIVSQLQIQSGKLKVNADACSEVADGINNSVTQINEVVQQVAETCTNQAGSAEDAHKNISGMGALIEEIGGISTDAHEALETLTDNMEQVESSVQHMEVQTAQTHDSVEKISVAADLISSISFQTNLLSLNASIEAARAGEFGKGFAVVASEIQQLAQRSDESAKEIQASLDELRTNSTNTLNDVRIVLEKVAEQSGFLNKTEGAFQSLEQGIGTDQAYQGPTLTSERAGTISAVQELAASTEQIAASMEETSASIQEVADMTQNMGEQASEMDSIAEVLEQQIAQFEIVRE